MIWERDKREVFERECEPLLNAAIAIMEKNQIPFFFCSCVSNIKDAEGQYKETYKKFGRTVASYGKTLPGIDEVSKHYAVTRGASVITMTEADLHEVHVPDDAVQEEEYEV